MVNIKKKQKGQKTYYYIEHSYREGKNVLKKEQYIGTTLPEDIEFVKKMFLEELYKEKWYPLFEIIKKSSANELRLTPKSAQEKEKETFAIQFTYDTQRIEGSTLTLKETARLLEKGITPAKPLRDVKEAEAHAALLKEILAYKKDFTMSIISFWHKKLFSQTQTDISGKIRRHGVRIAGSTFTPPGPVEVEPLLEDFFTWYKANKNKIHPVELAALVHLKFVTIHPFSDGNGRMSRLLMNFILQKHNYPPINIPYKNRLSYYTALERSQTKKHDAIFVQWFFKRYTKEHQRYLRKKS